MARQCAAIDEPTRIDALVSLGHFSLVPDRLHRCIDGLVYRRSRAAALGCLRAFAHQGRGHTLAAHGRRAGLTGWLRRGLRLNFVRLLLYLQAVARRTDYASDTDSGRDSEPAFGLRR